MRTRRSLLALAVAGVSRAADAVVAAGGKLRGKLKTGRPAMLEGVELTGDDATLAVLADSRLQDADFEAAGETVAPGRMKLGPIHTRSMYVWKEGKRLMISYWCAVCSIRTFSPGVCMCCQEDTELDLKEKFENTK
jgi:hypothetical protein